MKDKIKIALGVFFFCAAIYAMYWVFKSVSYNIFYEDMVKDTVIEVLKANQLIK